MDCSYIEDESIHIMVPYTSEPRWSLNLTFESIDEGEHQVSRPFEHLNVEESDIHHQYIPYWHLLPSKANVPQISRPNTLIVSIPLKKHLLDDSSYLDDDDNDNLILSKALDTYGRTGLFIMNKLKWDPPFESRLIEEFEKNPVGISRNFKECRVHLCKENTMLNKIIIDFCVEYWRNHDKVECLEWIDIAKEFYEGMEKPIYTNFEKDGILHFERIAEYLAYFGQIERDLMNRV